MAPAVLLERTLPPRAASAAAARRVVSEALADTAFSEVTDSALVAVSELVTNALVHAGTEIGVQVCVDESGVLVEVADGNSQSPVLRQHSRQSGTGRGLHMVEGLADEWGVFHHDGGKTVWFRMGQPSGAPAGDSARGVVPDTVTVRLLDFPLLIHAAWQEHCATLLREYLLMSLTDDDEITAFQRHAEASEALLLMEEQTPALDLEGDPDRVMADAIEPRVTVECVELVIPTAMVDAFLTLDLMMSEAVEAADGGLMLVPSTQPELRELRRWVCDQVRAQSLTGAEPEPWASDLHHDVTAGAELFGGWQVEVSDSEELLIAANDVGQIVAVSSSAALRLGYEVSEIVGKRVLVLIPPRFRQAHVAGLTQHLINGRDVILGQEITVPMLTADGSEVLSRLVVRPVRSDGRHMFVAEIGEP